MISIYPVSAGMAGSASADGLSVPLSGSFNQTLAERYIWARQEREAILAAGNNPDVASDPARLHAAQRRMEAYSVQLQFAAAFVNHGVKAIETVVKS